MKKKCVRWTKSVRTALVAAAAIVTALVVTPVAQTNDPSAQPKLAFADISYLGGFRLPAESSNGDSFASGGRQLTFNPAGNSLFIGSRAGRVAEISIPSPVNSSNAAALPFATYLQPFADPTEGQLAQITGEGVALDSLMVYNNRLYGTASVYYDANNAQRVSHYSRSLQLNEPSFSGWSSVWAADKTGFVSGAMSVVPAEWRALLGGPAATGQCCLPIVMRTSWGPSAFAFDPAKIGQGAVAASPLVYYTGSHPTLGQWDAANPTYGATIQMGGMAMIAGTRTVLYIGRNGTGANCYGNGTADQSLAGTIGADGAHWCYDPTNSDKGQHAYPYRYQIWAYDMNDFAAVKAGTKQPWEVVPYGVWPFDFPTPEQSVRIGGVGYDPATQRLYVSQLLADRDGYSYRPVVHVLQINATPGAQAPATTEPTAPVATAPTTTVPPATANAPATSNVVSAITMSVNRTAPQVAGTAITFTAFAIGGVQPQEYKWLIDDGTGFKAVTAWSVIDSFVWTPATANANYRVGVWARSSGNTNDVGEASATAAFPVIEPAPVPVSSVTVSANKASPQAPGTAITFQAVATGGSLPVEYKWMIYDGSPTWVQPTGWTSSSTFTWTPTTAKPDYVIRVWARSARVNKDEAQAQAEVAFAINTPAPVRLSAVTMTANKTAPQVAGTAVTFTAAAVGGAAQYKFLLYDGSPTWQFLTGWTTQNSYTWTPASANPSYQMRVLVKSANSTSDDWDADTRIEFPITAAAAPAEPVTAVTLTANLAAPQVTGKPITFVATTAGTTSVQYKFLLYDGSPTWQFLTGWTAQSSFTWTPTAANSNYQMRVLVRRATVTTDDWDADARVAFPINAVPIATTPVVAAPAPAQPIGAVTLSTSKPAPQVAGTTITIAAAVSGGSSTLQYRWLIHDGGSWTIVTGWQSSNTYAWTPTVANANHFVGVWVRNAANSNGEAESTASLPFPIK